MDLFLTNMQFFTSSGVKLYVGAIFDTFIYIFNNIRYSQMQFYIDYCRGSLVSK